MEAYIITGEEGEQGSDSWKKFRSDKIFASEMPIILGVSPFCSRYLLWQRKLGFAPEQEENWAMRKGTNLEPVARDLANIELSANFEPCVVIHKDLDWAGASLDGLDKKKKAILEIKCPGIKDHQLALEGKVSPKYFDQVQWQLFCSDQKICYYASYYDGLLAIVKVKRDDDYIAETLLSAATEFYRCLIDMVEPEKCEADYTQIVDDKFGLAAENWKLYNKLRRDNEKEEKRFRDKMIEFTDDSNCRGFGVKLTRCSREGRFDLDTFLKDTHAMYPGLAEKFPVQGYRQEQIGYWKVSLDKDG